MAAPMISNKVFNLCKSLSGLSIRRSIYDQCNGSSLLKSSANLYLIHDLRPRPHNFCLPRKTSSLSTQSSSFIHTSAACRDLNEFFDKKENFGEPQIRVGRPYRLDELRLKSNTDLHKLWYVLLKERNMLMTMAEEYKRENELFPNPERLEKVEDSMENILDVVRERDTTLSLLETGEIPQQVRKRWVYNELGIGYWRKYREHFVPIYLNTGLRKANAVSGRWQQYYLRLYREAKLKVRRKAIAKELSRAKKLKELFPHAEVEPDLEKYKNTLASTSMRGPGSGAVEGQELNEKQKINNN